MQYYTFSLSQKDKARLIESLSKSHALSVQFNENLELRYFLWKKGIECLEVIPNIKN